MNEPFLERSYWKVILYWIRKNFQELWSFVQSFQGHPGGDDEDETFWPSWSRLCTPPSWILGVAPLSCRGSWEASTVNGRPSNQEEFVEENPAQLAREMRLSWFILRGSDGVEQTEDILWPEPHLLDTESLENAAAEICVKFSVQMWHVQ